MQEGLKAIYCENFASSIDQEKKYSLDPLRQISPHLHLQKRLRQYDCYTDIQSRKNCCKARSLPLIRKGMKQTWMKTIMTMQNHGTQYPTSPMQITKQRKSFFSYLLTVSKIDVMVLRRLITFCCVSDRLVESPRMKRALEAVYQSILPKGSSPFIYLRFSLFSHLMKIADICLVCILIHGLWMSTCIRQSEKSTSSMKKQSRNE